MFKKITTTCLVGLVFTLGACANKATVAELQKPVKPFSQAMLIEEGSEFYKSFAVSSVTGMSNYSWFFPEPNRTIFKPFLASALNQAGMHASENQAARYHVTVEFSAVDGATIGGHMDAYLRGRYIVTDTFMNEIIYDDFHSSYSEAFFPGLTEQDFVAGRLENWLDLDALGLLPFVENDANHPVSKIMTEAEHDYRSGEKFAGAFNGNVRSAQVNRHVMRRNIASFMKGFREYQGLKPVMYLPCNGGPRVDDMRMDLIKEGYRVRSITCMKQ